MSVCNPRISSAIGNRTLCILGQGFCALSRSSVLFSFFLPQLLLLVLFNFENTGMGHKRWPGREQRLWWGFETLDYVASGTLLGWAAAAVSPRKRSHGGVASGLHGCAGGFGDCADKGDAKTSTAG